MTINSPISRRKADRVGREHLPALLQSIILTCEDGYKTPAFTYDASMAGLGLSAPMTAARARVNSVMTITPLDNSFQLSGTVAFVIPDGNGSCRFGVCFKKETDEKRYRTLLAEAQMTI